MDTSETYIKQCDCPEIQGQRSKEGIELACWVTRHLYISKSFDYWSMVKTPHVWLPLQDQIQEMLEGHEKPDYLIVSLVNFMQDRQRFYKSGRVKKLYPVGSMEQLWLAYYMWEYHKKIWDGKKWVVEPARRNE